MIRILSLILCLTVASGAAPPERPRLEPLTRTVWSSPSERFGGFSALEVLDDGTSVIAISDRGLWARGRLERDEDGALERVRTIDLGRLHGVDGKPLERGANDSEGMALAPDGTIYVSFEGFARVRAYPDLDGPARSIAGHPDFPKLQHNSSLEALAIDADGTIYTIPERSGQLTRPFPIYRLKDGVWDKRLSIPREGKYLVVGADFGPDGRLYVLERDFSWLGGFANRLRRFEVGPESVDAGVTLYETTFGAADNFEGISVWRDRSGEIRVTLIADNNFLAWLPTMIAEFRVVED